jgi:hypothetical protein
MVKKPNQPAETAAIKQQIETIVGHEIDPGVERLIKFYYPVGSYTGFGQVLPQSVHACWRRIYPFPNKVCSVPEGGLLEATGVSSTLADGKRVFQVSDVVCPQGASFGFGEPINVVATPLAESRTFLTMTYWLIQQGPDPSIHPDIQITVFAWNANGAPAPNVGFDWRCRAVWLFYPLSPGAREENRAIASCC